MKTAYRQLLVHLDSSQRSMSRLGLARRLAQEQGAEVAALYAVTPSLISLPVAPAVGPEMVTSMMEIDDERRRRARAAFDLLMQEAGPKVSWGEIAEPPTIGAVAQQALYADLLVLGQHEPGSPPVDLPVDFAESVMAVSGKPALLVPYADVPLMVGGTVVVAWKETREAALAVTAALPLLQRAEAVHVLTWGGEEPPAGEGARLDLRGYLKLHEVDVSWHSQGTEPEMLGELLLSRAFDLGADLLVMGCYGHSRAREWVLGGASRSVLQSMTLPVLMAH